MKEKYLTLEQNICAARIFLNTFGLSLEIINDVNEFSIIKIFDKAMNEVGKLYFDNGKVKMIAKYNNSVLNASFEIAKMLGFIDYESSMFAKNGDWNSNITFQINKSNDITLYGEFLICCEVDTEFGISCSCRPLINFEIPGIGKIILRISRDGRIFGLEIMIV